MTQAFVYKWTHIPTLKWYVGSRTANACHIGDGYICSSKIVKPLILSNPNEWKREIIEIGSSEDMKALEFEILECTNAKDDPRSFNKTNGSIKFSTAGLIPHNKGRDHLSVDAKRRISESRKGKPTNLGRKFPSPSEETRKKLSDANLRRPPASEETRKKLSAAWTPERRVKRIEWLRTNNPTKNPLVAAKISKTKTGKKYPRKKGPEEPSLQ